MNSCRTRARLVVAPPESVVPFVFSCRRVRLQALGFDRGGNGLVKRRGNRRREKGNKRCQTINDQAQGKSATGVEKRKIFLYFGGNSFSLKIIFQNF